MKLEPQKSSEDGGSGTGGVGRREVCGYGRNIFMGYLNRDNDTKVSVLCSVRIQFRSMEMWQKKQPEILKCVPFLMSKTVRQKLIYRPPQFTIDTSQDFDEF